MSFLVLHNMSNFILKVFQCLLDWKELAPEIQGLSSTYYNFQALWRPWIFLLKFKDVQVVNPVEGVTSWRAVLLLFTGRWAYNKEGLEAAI